MGINTTVIDRKKYPQLDLLLWSYHGRMIDGKHAFDVYERKWRYVHEDKLTKRERELIDKLALRYGKGLMLTS